MFPLLFSNTVHESYPDWATVKNSDATGEIAVIMKKDEECIGYAVILNKHNDYGNYDVYDQLPYLASFEVKYKLKGLGKEFLKHIFDEFGPFILRTNVSTFFYSQGANIIQGDIYESCTMVFGGSKTSDDVYMRKKCKLCDMFHLISDPDECIL